MSRSKKKYYFFDYIFNFVLNLTIAPLLIFKIIGDFILFLFRNIYFLILYTYKILLYFLKLPINLFLKLIRFFQTSKKNAIRPILKKGIIYRSTSKSKEFLSKAQKFYKKIFRKPKKFKIGLKQKTKRKSLFSWWIKIKYFFLGSVTVSVIFLYFQIDIFIKNLPKPSYLNQRDLSATTKIFDRNGQLLYEIYSEENRIPIKLNEVPKIVIDATIATEDKEFYLHEGFSLRGILRAFIHNLSSDSLEGGSTITQQLIRSAFLTSERTLSRKIKEVFLSILAEQVYSKNEILEMYLNQVPYGGTAWGIEAASQTYFGKSTKTLTLSEATLLAGLPSAPSKYSPFGINPKAYKLRQIEVLEIMKREGFIDQKEYEEAINSPLSFKPLRTPIAAPHFVMYVKEILEKNYGPRLVENGGLRVTTTLDLSLNEKVQDIITEQVTALNNLRVGNGAALITNPQNGEILTMIGSTDYFDQENDGNVNVTRSQRQPGSSIKVVNYAAALQLGFTAVTIINDSRVSYSSPGQPTYTPVNYDGRFHGNITLRTALASSYNVPAVKVLATIGVDKMIELGRKMGITSWQDSTKYGLSLTLGGGDVTMQDMAKVYGTLASGGISRELTPFIKITDYKGNNLSLPRKTKEKQTVPQEVAFILSSILSDNQARTPAFGANSLLNIPGKTVAVKTGTSDNKRDNWTIGYTPNFVTVVWVGNNDNSPMHPTLTSGVTGAAPIWNEVMTYLLKDQENTLFKLPEGIVTVKCSGRNEYFIKGTEPKIGCSVISKTQ